MEVGSAETDKKERKSMFFLLVHSARCLQWLKLGPGWRLELETQSRFPTLVAGTQLSELSPVALLGYHEPELGIKLLYSDEKGGCLSARNSLRGGTRNSGSTVEVRLHE